MATINVTITTPQGNVVVNKSVANGDLVRLIAALGDFHDGAFRTLDEQGNPVLAKTNENILKEWINYWLKSAQRQVKDYETRNAVIADVGLTDV